MKSILIFATLLFCTRQAFLQPTKTDSVIYRLNGCWSWDHYFGGFAGLPPTAANEDVRVEFFQDAQDSANHSVSCSTFVDAMLKFTGRCAVTLDTFGYGSLSCPLFDSTNIAGSPPVTFNFENDTLLFPQQQIVDGFIYGFLKDCADTTDTEAIDSVINRLSGCWSWDHYFGGLAGLPPTAATYDVRVEFFQDSQDSANHSVSCNTYKNSSLKFTGRCAVTLDTFGYSSLSCPLFDSTTIAGSPPVIFYFENDTLLFPQQEFVDGFVYGFLNCEDTTTEVESPDETTVHVWPNPASEYVVIRMNDTEFQQLNLYNSIGRKVASIDSVRQKEVTIYISPFPDGIYFISLLTSKGLLVKHLIIQRQQ